MAGTLYLVATPIGNLEDITLRALRVLKEADLIACEDTRHTRRLLSHYEISKPLVSYHEHNEKQRAAELVSRLECGVNIALVTDAGTPLVSDPGYRLVREAIKRAVLVVPIPGPSALIAALMASGMMTDEFTFAGFLPPKRQARLARLARLSDIKSTLILYEAPHRIRETIADARTALGDRTVVIAREITKLHEQFIRGRLAEIDPAGIPARGEIVLLIGPPSGEPKAQGLATEVSIGEQIAQVMKDEGLDQKTALKQVARLRQISKSAAYKLLLEEREANKVE